MQPTQGQKTALKASLCKKFNKVKEVENSKLFYIIINAHKEIINPKKLKEYKDQNRKQTHLKLMNYAKELTIGTPINYKSILTITNTTEDASTRYN